MSKTSRSGSTDGDVEDLFFALGDRHRLSVVRTLRARGALSATMLADDAIVTRQAIVKHLRILERAGLVSHQRRGREVLYALEARRLDEARTFLDGISAGWDRAITRLRRLVEEP
ncbi:MAG TPA: metalloregulator ArsR/SmtB family transcription factor [Gemmatimonas sp.]|uniref:ArsR/SmtB family transcription factor n=1 Tax=Gemmatimonas sp. TaxID=1962908 RepID=UPI002EDB7802